MPEHNSETDPPRPRRRPLACQRCRRRKVKCDTLLPACSNCVKANVPCEEAQGADRHLTIQLENRIQWLESIIRNIAPQLSLDADLEIAQLQPCVLQLVESATDQGQCYQVHRQPHNESEYSFQTAAGLCQVGTVAHPPRLPAASEMRATPRANGQSPLTP